MTTVKSKMTVVPMPTTLAPQRLVLLLETLALSPEGLTLSKLSQLLRTPKSSLLNLLRALMMTGHVENSDGLYRLGNASLQLGAMIAGCNPLLRSVRPLLRRLAHKSGETAMLGILAQDRQHAMYVESVESRNALGFAVPIGRPTPLYCSAIGRTFLAFQDDDDITAYFSKITLKAYTPHTITRKTDLKKLLLDIRRTGIAESRNQMTEGVAGISAAVFDVQGRVAVVVVLGAPVEKITGRKVELTDLVKQIGIEMSEVLGYRGPYPPKSLPKELREVRI